MVLTYDRPLAGFLTPGAGGFGLKIAGVPQSIDHVECIDEEFTVQIYPDFLLNYDQCTYDGVTPLIQPFAGGDAADAFDHPIPWP